jgi:hypothetical protein
MAYDKATPPVFMDLPLEVRHCIFEYAAARDVKPKKLLRYWFEKEEVKDAIAKLAVENPGGPTPRVQWNDHREYDEESEVAEEEEDEEADGAEEQDSDDEENEDAEQDEDDEEDGQDEEEEGALDDTQINQSATAASQVPAPAPAKPTPSAQPTAQVEEEERAEDEVEDEMEGDPEEAPDEHQEGATETQDTQADVAEEEERDSEDDAEMADGDDDGSADPAAAPVQQPPPPVPVIGVHHKWCHIPKFMRLTQCPPPVELLLTSKQLDNEAKNWFYDVAVLRIDATGSFAHTSFFEEAFKQITDAAFSPMENIRKVEVTFVWDSTWIRADTSGCVGAIFPALLGQRASFVYQILSQAPDLKELVINW